MARTNLVSLLLPLKTLLLGSQLNTDKLLQEAAQLIKNADAIAIFAGAGLGVDSGLEAYRSDTGLWKQSIIVNYLIEIILLTSPSRLTRHASIILHFRYP